MKLYKLFGGGNTKIFNHTTHTAKDAMPTVYIVSHKFSFMDILIAFEVFSQLSPANQRAIGGVCDVPEWFQIALTTIFNWVCPTMHLISYNKRCGNATKEMTKHLYLGDDIIIWQHPYNKSRGLYYILEQCIREYNMTPRLVYIDISDKMTATTVNNESPINIFRKVRNKLYYVTSHEIEYKIDLDITYDIHEQFTKPFWDQVCAKLKG